MNKLVGLSLAAAMVASVSQASGVSEKLDALEKEIAALKKQLKKQKKKLNEVKAHDAGDNIKWSADLRTSVDNINYDMADGSSRGKDALWAMRLWLNMEFAPDNNNVFKAQLSMNKAFGADFGVTPNPTLTPFGMRGTGMDTFDWVANEALTNNNLKVRQAYWLYLSDKLFDADIPWTFSLGRRPSTNGFLANLRDDDPAQSPLGHIINVEFDGLSSKFDLSNVTGIPGMSFKVCMGQGSTNAVPLFGRLDGTAYSEDANALKDVKLAGFIFEPYNDGQYIVKTTWYKAFDLPGFSMAEMQNALGGARANFSQNGNMYGAAISVMVDGLTEEGILSETKVFGSFAWSKTDPDAGASMLGSADAESGTSYWIGAQVPVIEGGKFGLEYNYGSEYWRPFTYAEDTMIGSKLAARGDAWEAYFTYQLTEALSAQIRYTAINYDYTGSNGFFGAGGMPLKISDVKQGAAMWQQLGGTADPASGNTVYANLAAVQGLNPADPATQQALMPQVQQMGMAAAFLPNIVEKAQDLRVYLRYRF